MEKTIIIDNKEVRLKSTGATPIRYKSQFGKDFFSEIMKLNHLTKIDTENLEASDFSMLEMDIFYNFVYVLAKTVDRTLPDPISWLDSFDEFPILEIIPEIQDILMSSMQSKKKM
ncbi:MULTISPECIES: hypothetical protein [unclassified Bacillus (in: firmicutes)]|uniref:hypothetical protein n=1 Tax=unclassified Bacillus (in: firmicutes) TaxID=185979 RepID=UPI0008EB0C84|nr:MULTISPECIES: hypothetical protein [unclassified Bacillus (in: firmicutes)]SFI36184.1 hypothetical protein SAMN04488574_102460 [Bacillus sp. 71mf]SFS34815.1 hypothetical protein SAMN04488145_1015 [Bacillus sp. 103mf]